MAGGRATGKEASTEVEGNMILGGGGSKLPPTTLGVLTQAPAPSLSLSLSGCAQVISDLSEQRCGED